MTEKSNKPTILGFFTLLIRVFLALIFLCAIALGIIAIPFMLSLMCVAALAVSGLIIFSWAYVWIGTVFILLSIGYIFG